MTEGRKFLPVFVFSLTAIWASQAGAQIQFGPNLHTPPLWGNHFVCSVANVGYATQLVGARIVVNGKEAKTNPIPEGCKNLKPGQTCGEIAAMQGVELAYCRISVAPGPKEEVRAGMIGTDQGTGRSAAVEAR